MTVAGKKELIIVREYLHKDEDEIPEWIFNDKETLAKYYDDPGQIDYRLYEVAVEAVFDPNNMTYTVMGFKLGNDLYVKKDEQ